MKLVESMDYSNIFDVYKDLHLTIKKEWSNLLFHGIQEENDLKARLGEKMSDGTDLTVNTEENAIVKTVDQAKKE